MTLGFGMITDSIPGGVAFSSGQRGFDRIRSVCPSRRVAKHDATAVSGSWHLAMIPDHRQSTPKTERIIAIATRRLPSVENGDGLKATLDSIRETYLQDGRPWVIGFSGGKDSTATLQLVWQALRTLPNGSRQKPIHVISSNTLVETPAIVSYIRNSIAAIERAGREDGLDISGKLVEPRIDDSFWVNLLGRGYPAPSNKFRWCTERLKISPADLFIKDQVAQYGEVVLALGVRSAESATRAQVMSLRKIEGTRLRTHKKLAGALVFAPIEDWTTNDVWSYLLQNPETPWGSDNNDLAAMYRTADAECPLVVDTMTPSCGNSRFGCWVCTVVTRDKSMEAMVDSGQTWMESLLEIRDELSDTQRSDRSHEVRSARKLNGRVLLKNQGNELALGPYTFAYCRSLLGRILRAQRDLPPEADGFELISDNELLEIRRIWRSERHDWEDSLPRIYEDCTGKRWFSISEASSDAEEDAGIVDRTAIEFDVPELLMRKLIDAERRTFGLRRRSDIYKTLNNVLDRDWRDEDTLLADLAAMEQG
jgi:DNA sulfur modification protein DndC